LPVLFLSLNKDASTGQASGPSLGIVFIVLLAFGAIVGVSWWVKR
jgi:hypothetical protein